MLLLVVAKVDVLVLLGLNGVEAVLLLSRLQVLVRYELVLVWVLFLQGLSKRSAGSWVLPSAGSWTGLVIGAAVTSEEGRVVWD